ncbi:MAG: SpoIID/LytB domain-containing protein [Bacteroidaceae bacterium]|nr:SpoIID/LytB domain-containing protein [Bacteroidaceae bacterium]
MKEPVISVGILHDKKIRFNLHDAYCMDNKDVQGESEVTLVDGSICWCGKQYEKLEFVPKGANSTFSLYDVVIGIDFHWERKENQTFMGTLRFIIDEGTLCAVNVLTIEDYLKSVISSEMSATASLEFLKAHAVISRSWALAQVKAKGAQKKDLQNSGMVDTEELHIKWYDHDAHSNFDVCADDHCQRYQGITRIKSHTALEAIEQTRGRVLMYDGEICDARFSKCCGGIMEEFQNCWENTSKPYLVAKQDAPNGGEDFCNTNDKRILSQVLNGYDQETAHFYRWTQEYSVDELSQLVKQKSGVDFGTILDLIPVLTGPSGRHILLKIVGTKKILTVGKELEIRKWLSPTHLYSSAFDVEKQLAEDGTTTKFILHGKGWGHGVGLCQIGAAVMGDKGYKFDEILMHYYPNSEIKNIY